MLKPDVTNPAINLLPLYLLFSASGERPGAVTRSARPSATGPTSSTGVFRLAKMATMIDVSVIPMIEKPSIVPGGINFNTLSRGLRLWISLLEKRRIRDKVLVMLSGRL